MNAYRKLFLAAVFMAMLAAACYDNPARERDVTVIELDYRGITPVPADGHTVIDILVKVDAKTDRRKKIRLTSSTGRFEPEGTAEEGEPSTITRGVSENGLMSVKLQVGRTPGTAVVSADIDGYYDLLEIPLSYAPPQQFIMESNINHLVLDGAVRATVDLTLFSQPALVFSEGSLVGFSLCCLTRNNERVSCPTRPPVSVLPSVQFGAEDNQKVFVTTERIYDSDPNYSSAFTVTVSGQLLEPTDEPPTILDCRPATDTNLADEIFLSLAAIGD